MQTLFNYTTLSTRLEKSTRTLFVTLNRPEWNNAFRMETLFEIESLLSWCTTRVEINTIFFDSSAPSFSSGLELDSLAGLKASQLDKINTKLQKIIFSLMQLPQTVVMDLGDGSQTLGSEFALGADIRLASNNAKISFNHGHFGLVPGAGGMSMLSTIVSPAFARAWVLSGAVISQKALSESGFIAHSYEASKRTEVVQQTLLEISKIAPVQRIQAKLGLFESLRSQFETGIVMDRKVAKAAMVTEDWRTKIIETPEKEFSFTPAKSLSYAVKLSIVKNDESTKNLEH